MVQYLASDIIRQAKTMGNVSNVNTPNFELSTTLLNYEYQKLYDRIVMANGANIKEEYYDSANGDEWFIPDDCYHIIGIYRNKKLMQKSSPKQYISGNYRIENNRIIFDGADASSEVMMKYSTLPETLTAPDEPVELFKIKECGKVTDKGFYYIGNDNEKYFYDFASETAVNVADEDYKTQSIRYIDYELIFKDGKISYCGEDVTYVFEREGVEIKSVRVSDPYAIVNYSDNRSYIFYHFEGGDQLNWNESKGKETYGEVLGFTTNDITGKGCIWKDIDGDVYYTSFTPDTLLNYPSNTFFQLLIYRLAASLTALNGVQNQYLIEVQIPEAEVAFAEHLAKDNVSAFRMNNDIL